MRFRVYGIGFKVLGFRGYGLLGCKPPNWTPTHTNLVEFRVVFGRPYPS